MGRPLKFLLCVRDAVRLNSFRDRLRGRRFRFLAMGISLIEGLKNSLTGKTEKNRQSSRRKTCHLSNGNKEAIGKKSPSEALRAPPQGPQQHAHALVARAHDVDLWRAYGRLRGTQRAPLGPNGPNGARGSPCGLAGRRLGTSLRRGGGGSLLTLNFRLVDGIRIALRQP